MYDQPLLFTRFETRSYFDALARHEDRYGLRENEAEKSAQAVREKLARRRDHDERCQAFFDLMASPPSRRRRNT